LNLPSNIFAPLLSFHILWLSLPFIYCCSLHLLFPFISPSFPALFTLHYSQLVMPSFGPLCT
jgi:hypothetical protein